MVLQVKSTRSSMPVAMRILPGISPEDAQNPIPLQLDTLIFPPAFRATRNVHEHFRGTAATKDQPYNNSDCEL